MRILGIDPGYAIMGWAVLDHKGNHFKAVDYGAITTDAGVDMPLRLQHLYTELCAIIERYRPDEASIEELFFNNNAKTVIHVGEARGIAILACANARLKIGEYTPLQIKQALVGYGRADKKQVQEMVKTILNLEEVPKPDDTADAVAAAICHGHVADQYDRLGQIASAEFLDEMTGKGGSAGASGKRRSKKRGGVSENRDGEEIYAGLRVRKGI